MAFLPTIKVKSDDTSFGYIIINESDFDASVHERFEEPAAVVDAVDPPAVDPPPADPVADATGAPADETAAASMAGAFDALSAREAIEAVKAMADVAALQAARATESRTTVTAAIDKRIADLTAGDSK